MNSAMLYKLANLCLQEKLAGQSRHAYVGFLRVLNEHRDRITPGIVDPYMEQFSDENFAELLTSKVEKPIPEGDK